MKAITLHYGKLTQTINNLSEKNKIRLTFFATLALSYAVFVMVLLINA